MGESGFSSGSYNRGESDYRHIINRHALHHYAPSMALAPIPQRYYCVISAPYGDIFHESIRGFHIKGFFFSICLYS